MLIEFKCKNHKSIKDEIVFSALATKDTFNEEYLYDFGDLKISKYSIIYGANGSGKSNFIDAISFMKSLVENSLNYPPTMGIATFPHKLKGQQSKSSYSIQFIRFGIIYTYGFTIQQMMIENEYLYYFPKGRQTKIFERNKLCIEEGSKFKNKFTNCEGALKSNKLLLSCAASLTNIEEINYVYRYLSEKLVIHSNKSQESWIQKSLSTLHTNPKLKNLLVSFIKSLGIDIKDIEIEAKKSPQALPPQFLSDCLKNEILLKHLNKMSLTIQYPTFKTDLFSEESVGIQKLFTFLCPYLDAILTGKILIFDELEANLHESLIHSLLKTFLEFSKNPKAQIFFTTHNTGLLSLNLFRRDQIWFTELRNTDRSTVLYSLAEIKNIRKDENYSKGYISGRYGAIPVLNENFASLIKKANGRSQ